MMITKRRKVYRLSDQMRRANHDAGAELRRQRIAQVLALLEDSHLTTALAEAGSGTKEIELECGFAKEVWPSYDITRRVQQLAQSGIVAKLDEHVFQAHGKSLTRPVIKVQLSS